MPTVLVVDDERSIRRFLRVGLEAAGYEVVDACDGREGLSLAASARPDVVVLDLGLPDMSGFAVLERLREWTELPVLVLTVQDQEDDKVRALDAGADDYVTKPFGMPELLARLRAALRRAGAGKSSEAVFASGPLSVDRESRQVRVNGHEVYLTSTEYALLLVLVRNAGKVVTHRHLLREVWGPNATEHVQYLRVYMGQIRKKLKSAPDDPELIATETGVGYRLLV